MPLGFSSFLLFFLRIARGFNAMVDVAGKGQGGWAGRWGGGVKGREARLRVKRVQGDPRLSYITGVREY